MVQNLIIDMHHSEAFGIRIDNIGCLSAISSRHIDNIGYHFGYRVIL